MDAVSYSNFRQHLKTYMQQVNEDAEPIIVTARDKEDNVVVISQHDYDSLQETMHIMSNPELMAKIKRGDEQFAAGKATTHELLTDFDDD